MKLGIIALAFIVMISSLATAAWWNASFASKDICTYDFGATGVDSMGNPILTCIMDTKTLIALGSMRSDCGDLRAVNQAQDTNLSYEVEGCNQNNTAIHFRVPQIIGRDYKAYIYYNNSSVSGAENNTWKMWRDAGYVSVYHFDNTSTTLIDHAAYNNMTIAGADQTRCTASQSVLGSAIAINNTYASGAPYCYYTKASSVGMPYGANPAGTMTAWIRQQDGYNSEAPLFSLGGRAYSFDVQNSSKLMQFTGGGTYKYSGTTFERGSNYFYGYAYNNADGKIYFYPNGAVDTTLAVATSPLGNDPIFIAGENINNIWVSAVFDEMRIRNQTSNASWMAMERNSIANATVILPAYVVACGGVSNTSFINLSTKDEINNNNINANIITLITYQNGSIALFNGTSNYSLCIYPATGSPITITLSATLSATGYYPRTIINQTAVDFLMQNRTYYMLNQTDPTANTASLKLFISPSIAVVDSVINVYSFTPPSVYTLLESCTTDASGACFMHLIGSTKEYIYNITGGYTFGPELLSCPNGGQTICYRTFTIGGNNIPPIISNNLNGQCIYVNATKTISCIATDASQTLTSFSLNASSINGTSLCNSGASGSTASLNCVFPPMNDTIYFTFYGNDNSGNAYILSQGYIFEMQPNPSGLFGRNGWLALLILFVVFAMAAYYNLGLSMAMGLFGIGIGMMVGIIPLSALTWQLFAGMAVVALIIIYRMKI